MQRIINVLARNVDIPLLIVDDCLELFTRSEPNQRLDRRASTGCPRTQIAFTHNKRAIQIVSELTGNRLKTCRHAFDDGRAFTSIE